MTMNRIKIFALAAIAAGFASCSGDEGFDIKDNGVKVLAAETELAATGGQGSVTVDKAVSTAYAKDAWLTVSADGTKVSVAAAANSSRETRATLLVIKASAEDSVIVSVQQHGLIYNAEGAESIEVTDEVTQQLIAVTTNGTVEIVSCPDWITATVTEDGVLLDISENTTGRLRYGNVVFGAGGYETSVTVTQADEDENPFGSYIIGGYNRKGQFTYLPCTLTREAIVFNPSTSGLDLTIPITFEQETSTVTISNGAYLGKYSSYHVYLMLENEDGDIDLPTTEPKGRFVLENDPDAGFMAVMDGDWGGGKTSSGLLLAAFTEQSFTEDAYAGYIFYLNPVMLMMQKE